MGSRQPQKLWLNPETAIIGLSVNTANENQIAMIQAGAKTLLNKESAVEQLYAAVKREKQLDWTPG